MKNIFNKIIAALVGLLSFITLFVPQLAFADDLSSFFLGASMGGRITIIKVTTMVIVKLRA